ncbi:hypothetical protein AMELA_G00168480 [Ameiurus melas]|uniref:Membrane-spanning 4-domains subfamily A member 4A-like n=1 Tax=Ameiurus melas TaxID=219545 RepID=A0A7J6ACE1_AMEME|nr:hypothetical protein AMELA_G00168480 [Ameiurus melas]
MQGSIIKQVQACKFIISVSQTATQHKTSKYFHQHENQFLVIMTPVTAPADTRISRRTTFLKGEPKELGIVQIMIGIMTLLFGIVLTSLTVSPAIISGITLWGSLIFISSGALSVAAANNYNSCVVKVSLGMNIFSAVVAGLTFILFPVDMLYGSSFILLCRHYSYDRYYMCDSASLHMWNGIYGVLLTFSLLEFIISICTSVFACKVITCCSETTVIYSQPMNSQPMYNPAFYYPQVPQQPSVITYNNV